MSPVKKYKFGVLVEAFILQVGFKTLNRLLSHKQKTIVRQLLLVIIYMFYFIKPAMNNRTTLADLFL